MLRNYLSVALQQLRARKLYSAINVIGLAVGLACFILIALFVEHETGYDSRWAHSDRIYRISRDVFATQDRTEAHPAGISGAAAQWLEADFPGVVAAARLDLGPGVVRSRDGEPHLEARHASADNAIFEIFDFDWVSGDPATALRGPFDVVLTEGAARRHFGDRDPMGRTLEFGSGLGEWQPLEVVGVIADLPADTHLDFSMLTSLESYMQEEGGRQFLSDWNNDIFYTYVLLAEDADIGAVAEGSAEFFERRLEPGASRWTDFTAMAVTDIHLHSDRENEIRPGGSAATVYSFAAIAALVLLLACVNFTNLATAVAAQRAKEIGVRKVLGAERTDVMIQFLAETLVQTSIAALSAVTAVELALPAFGGFLGHELAFDYLGNAATIGGLAALVLGTSIVAGAYPAFYLSAFQPGRALKDAAAPGGGAALRRILVVLQFGIAIALLIGTVVVHQQMTFVRGIDLGYDKDRILIVSPSAVPQWDVLKRELLAHPAISRVTASDVVPFEPNVRTAELRVAGSDARGRMEFVTVDYDFFETYRIALAAGRSFSADLDGNRQTGVEAGGEGSPFMINVLAARALGFTPDEALGQWVTFGAVQGARFMYEDASGPIVGVVADVHLEAVHEAIAPVVYRLSPGTGGSASLHLSGSDLGAALDYVDEQWGRFTPNLPVTRRFLDQDFDALYRAEERQRTVGAWFSALAILVACLGLFGLASFSTERRTKEIGVRKVMGGTIVDIVRLFTGEFGRLVLLANALAWPVAYLLMRRWLESFAYRIDLSPVFFVGSGLLALAVAVATVAAVATRAAAANPVKSLRSE